MNGALAVVAGVEEAGQDVVFVGREDEATDRQPHTVGHIPGEDVPEISGRHGKLNAAGTGQAHDPKGGKEVVNDLGRDASPVDRIDGADLVA